MSNTPGLRPGGRSARVQAAVHQAARTLQQEAGREGLTVPAIAARAGVTPSTIYRRWGDLAQLLADVAVEQLRPDEPPRDTGTFRGDALAWLDQYFEEMSSDLGRTMLRDVLGTPGHACAGLCAGFTRQQIEVMRARALERGETPPAAERIIDRVIAPTMYRLLFANEVPSLDATRRALDEVIAEAETPAGKRGR